MFHFDPITPYRVRDKHTYYASGISDAIDKGGSDCMAEDVMRAIYNGKVYLYDIISEEGDDLLVLLSCRNTRIVILKKQYFMSTMRICLNRAVGL